MYTPPNKNLATGITLDLEPAAAPQFVLAHDLLAYLFNPKENPDVRANTQPA